MADRLKGKLAFCTASSAGIGRATAIAFAREGGRVAVVDFVAEQGQETVDVIKASGGDAIFIQTDVQNAAAVEQMGFGMPCRWAQ